MFPVPFSAGYNMMNAAPGLGSMFGGLGSVLGGMFDMNQPNPASAGLPYLNQANGALNGVYGPWINQGLNATQPYLQAGNQAIPQLQSAISNMMSNPGGMVNQIGQSFQQSPGFAFQVDQATKAGNAAAAAGGMAGSPMEQQQLASTVNGLANQDYYNWLNQAMGMYSQGFSGLNNMFNQGANTANNMYSTGAQMANNEGQLQNQNYTNQAQMAYDGQINQNQQQGGGFGSIAGGIGGLISGAASIASFL